MRCRLKLRKGVSWIVEQPLGKFIAVAGVQIEPEAGGWRIRLPAAGRRTEQPCSVLLLEADEPGGAGRRLLQALAQQPLKLAALQEGGAKAIAGLLPGTPPWQPAEGPPRSRCGCCAEEPCGHAKQAASEGAAAWRAATPEQRLRLLGWTREALLAAVLAAWAEAQPLPDAAEALRAALGPLTSEARARTGGPSSAEWLAEMAEQGALHAPGPQFHDVRIDLDAAAEPLPSDEEAMAKLLPGVRGASKGLGLVREGVMQRAAELARQLGHKPC